MSIRDWINIVEDMRFSDIDLKNRYDHFNRLLFDNKLPDIPVTYAKLKTVGGVASAKVKTYPSSSRFGKKIRELVPDSLNIKISSVYQRDQNGIDGILVHEMIHIYFFTTGAFDENHGVQFKKMMNKFNAMVDFEVPLSDNVTGLMLTDAPKKKVGLIVLYKNGDKMSVAVVSEQYIRDNLTTLMERWTYFVKLNYASKVQIIVGSGRIEARYPIQRKQVKDLSYFIVKEPALIEEALEHGEILATIEK